MLLKSVINVSMQGLGASKRVHHSMIPHNAVQVCRKSPATSRRAEQVFSAPSLATRAYAGDAATDTGLNDHFINYVQDPSDMFATRPIREARSLAKVVFAPRVPRAYTKKNGSGQGFVTDMTVQEFIAPSADDAHPEQGPTFKLTFWDDKAQQACQSGFQKGEFVWIRGPITISKYTDRQGQEQVRLEMTPYDVSRLTDMPDMYVHPELYAQEQ